MRFVYRGFYSILVSCALITSCSSKANNNSGAPSSTDKPSAPFNPKELLAYDAKDADPRIDAFMQELHRTRAFNGNVLVAKHGKIIYENAIGWADYLHRKELNINSQFELASITKTMTGTAILQLIEQGKLSLNDDV